MLEIEKLSNKETSKKLETSFLEKNRRAKEGHQSINTKWENIRNCIKEAAIENLDYRKD